MFKSLRINVLMWYRMLINLILYIYIYFFYILYNWLSYLVSIRFKKNNLDL